MKRLLYTMLCFISTSTSSVGLSVIEPNRCSYLCKISTGQIYLEKVVDADVTLDSCDASHSRT